jgi:tetratricopeptide (TPR) repeat protein
MITLSITANIFVPVGTFMAERFLFMPSLGFCMIIAALIVPAMQRGKTLRISGISVVAALAAIWSVITLLRTPAWESEERLLKTDIVTSPNSAKLRNLLGTALLTKALNTSDPTERLALLQQAETHLGKAVEMHPTNFDAFLAYGACVFYLQKYDLAILSYRGAVHINPNEPKAKLGLAYALRFGGDYYAQAGSNSAKSVECLSESWQLNPDTATATHLAQQYLLMGQSRDAVMWMKQALSLAPNDPRLLEMMNRAAGSAPKGVDQEPVNSFLSPASGN